MKLNEIKFFHELSWFDRNRYNDLVDQGRHEGGLTDEESAWMAEIYRRFKDELDANRGLFK